MARRTKSPVAETLPGFLFAWSLMFGCQGGDIDDGRGPSSMTPITPANAGQAAAGTEAPGGASGGGVAGGVGTAGAAGTPATTPDAGGMDGSALQPDAGGPVDGGDDGGADAGDTTPSDGCGEAVQLSEAQHDFSLDGWDRYYILYLPTHYDPDRPWPLVLALHPNGGDTGFWDDTDGDRAIRTLAKQDAIVVLAQSHQGEWRDDVSLEEAYFEHVIAELKNGLCVDENRIFSMGFSGGGSFSGVLGCTRTDIRAIASAGAVIYFDEATCVGAPAAWVSIGVNELIEAREDFRDHWVTTGACVATSQPTAPAPCVAYDDCAPDTPVHYCEHPGGHEWPDFATQAVWDFFKQF